MIQDTTKTKAWQRYFLLDIDMLRIHQGLPKPGNVGYLFMFHEGTYILGVFHLKVAEVCVSMCFGIHAHTMMLNQHQTYRVEFHSEGT